MRKIYFGMMLWMFFIPIIQANALPFYPVYPSVNYGTGDQAKIIQRGEYLTKIGDCIACHTDTKNNGPAFAGGLGLYTPFGTFYAPNITPDKKTGIGMMSDDQFILAMQHGVRSDGAYDYPVFPYLNFAKVTKSDLLAIKAYLFSLPPIERINHPNTVPFPLNWRFLQWGWQLLFFHPGEYQYDAEHTQLWNRGAYLVQGLGHCGMCHTPTNFLGAPKQDYYLTGNFIQGYYAPDITATALKNIPESEIVDVFTQDQRLKGAGKIEGPMAEVDHDSLLYLTPEDLMAIATYLKTINGEARNDWRFNLRSGVTPISQEVYNLHMIAFLVCVGIAIVVFGAMIYALIFHRKSRRAQAAQFHEHTPLEIIWAIIPLIILIVLAIPATRILMKINDFSNADLTIKITAYQWKWNYNYLDQGVSFFSNLSTPQDQLTNQAPKDKWYLLEVDKPLIVPIHKKIRFLLTANDVIHSWWVPELGIKRDALPGFINEAWTRIEKPGIYRGQCSQLCGVNHAFMPIVVQALTEEDFNKWIEQQVAQKIKAAAAPAQNLTKDQLMARGEAVYKKTCAVCHKEDGSGMPPAFPALKGDKTTTGPIAVHINTVLNGRPGTAMQAFGAQLSDEDLAAVITYERNAWGNDAVRKANHNTEDMLQSTDITAAKKK